MPIVKAPHYGRWLGVLVVVVLIAQFVTGAITNPRFDWPTFAHFFFSTTVLTALWVTIQLTLYAAVIGFAGAIILALMRQSPNPLLRSVSWSFIWLFRSIPLIVQVLFWGFLGALYTHIGYGVPFGPVFGELATKDVIGPMVAAVIGLSIHQAAYGAEIIRAGLLSVDDGQREAAAALGIPLRRQFTRIIFPQAMRTIVPPATNEIIGLLKGTSAVFILALPDLFYQVQVIYGRNGRIIPLLVVAVAWYVILTGLLSAVQFYVERFFAKGAHREMPPTPLQKLIRWSGDARVTLRENWRQRHVLVRRSVR
ncbi:amino acid ABC transporter permease [Gordonia sp. ABSL11-1]|nr:amino acid ABC transporter permease [Gordonia sp. ABSL11-1]MDL9948114.1 amino acid ABC transporter permease [Gordonia sp. ABSL11-1]